MRDVGTVEGGDPTQACIRPRLVTASAGPIDLRKRDPRPLLSWQQSAIWQRNKQEFSALLCAFIFFPFQTSLSAFPTCNIQLTYFWHPAIDLTYLSLKCTKWLIPHHVSCNYTAPLTPWLNTSSSDILLSQPYGIITPSQDLELEK